MATQHKNPILSSFLLLLLFLSNTIVIAQDEHEHEHEHDTVPPPPPPPPEDDHDHDHDTVPPPPSPPPVDHDHDHDYDHDTVPPPPPPPPVVVVNIFDTNAKPVVSGQKYYILPVVQRKGGGIATTPVNTYEPCPLYVAQETNTTALGIPVTFSPIKPGSTNITFSTDMKIDFASPTGCKQSTWTLKPGFRYDDGTQYVTVGGSNGYGGPNTIKSLFKIERFFPRFNFDYKFVYYPSVPDSSKVSCGDLGVYIQEDGTWRIGVGAAPLRVKFNKA